MTAKETRRAIVVRANNTIGLNRDQLGMSGTYAWCAHYVSNVLRYVGIEHMYDTSCTKLQAKMDDAKDWDEPNDDPIPGDILFFDWDHIDEPLPLDHVGIVTAYDPATKKITYVNGNGSSSYIVTKQEMRSDSKFVEYWMRYVGEDAKPDKAVQKEIEKPKEKVMCTVELEQLEKGCASPSVETMQNLLVDVNYDIVVDGRFGDATDAALRQFQKDYKLTVDGICGPKTWKALIEAI